MSSIGEIAKFRTSIQTDTVNEYTSASGVTIDGVLLKDAEVTASGTNGLITNIIKAQAASGVKFQENGGGERGSYTDAGAWTLGPSTGATTTIIGASAAVGLALTNPGGTKSEFIVTENVGTTLDTYESTSGRSFSFRTMISGSIADIGGHSTTGAWTLGPTTSTQVNRINGYVAGNYNNTGNAYFVANTSDAADNAASFLCGGGDAGAGRGGNVYVYGNEHATKAGVVRLVTGASATGTGIEFATYSGGEVAAGSVTAAGAWTLGPSAGAVEHTVRGALSCYYDAGLSRFRITANASNTNLSSYGDDVSTSASITFLSYKSDGSGEVTTGSISGAGAWTLGPTTNDQVHDILSPTGTAGAVSTYLQIKVNGTAYRIPLHATA